MGFFTKKKTCIHYQRMLAVSKPLEDLSPSKREQLKNHLLSCFVCNKWRKEIKQLDELLQTLRTTYD